MAVCFCAEKGIFMTEQYKLINEQLKALIEDTDYDITDYANASALLFSSLEQINWAGFYLMKDGALLLGPFQGRTACTKIAVGKGVCGTAAELDRTIVVADVHQFAGHIACDSASRSEIVLPIHKDGKLTGVLDIDSPMEDRFQKEDEEGLQLFVRILEQKQSHPSSSE